MGTSNSKPSSRSLLYQLQFFISLIAIIFSSISLYLSIRSYSSSSSPNIQIQSAEGQILSSVNNETKRFDITSKILLKNFGRSPLQVINIRWEPIFSETKIPDYSIIGVAIADMYDFIKDPQSLMFYGKYKDNPILEIFEPTIRDGELKKFNVWISYEIKLKKYKFKGKEYIDEQTRPPIPNIRIFFYFSNGQEVIVMPSIKT